VPDLKPDLNVMSFCFGSTALGGPNALITLPGCPPVDGHWHEQKAFVEPYPNDAGTYSVSKSQRRGSLRLGELPPPPRPDVSWPPPGTLIDLGVEFGAETLTVVGVDYQDLEIAHVIAVLVT
jgi:hypothetical protein